MLILDKTAPTPFRWAPSSLQRFTTCEYSFYLRYLERHHSRQHAAAWFGSEIIHRMIQLAYHGLSLEESFDQVWQAACAPIVADLRAWLDLDREYRRARGGKRADAKEVVAWLKDYPAYRQLRERIDAYQQSALSYLRWNERIALADYYRRSAILLETSPEDVLLPHPWLVEGQWVEPLASSDSHDSLEPVAEVVEDDEKGRTYALLEGVIGDVPICGVPDVVACRDDGVMLVGDYKTSARPLEVAQLAMNMQLIIYCELLRQNGILEASQEVLIGHIYLTESGVIQRWTDTSLLPKRLPLIARQLAAAERRRLLDDFAPVAGIATSFHDPCPSCDMAHVCDALISMRAEED